MSNLKMFIACHKPCDVPHDDVYTPIQVGKGISEYELDMIGDDTGDNISAKNKTYCETTAQYWVWKNVHDVDFVGFCHYRRFFDYKFTNENIDDLFKRGIDVILPTPQIQYLTGQKKWLTYISSDDLTILLWIIHKLYPEYEETANRVLVGVHGYCWNMLVCRKSLFDEYAEWLFSILQECEKYMKPSPYSRAQRIYGYIAEFLLSVFFLKHDFKIKTFDIVVPSREGMIIRKNLAKERLLSFCLKQFYKVICKTPYLFDATHIDSLRRDGIPVDFE